MRRPVLIAFATGMALMALLAAAPGDRQQDATAFHARLLPTLETARAPTVVMPAVHPRSPLHQMARPDGRPDRWSIGRDRTDRPTRDPLPFPGTSPTPQEASPAED